MDFFSDLFLLNNTSLKTLVRKAYFFYWWYFSDISRPMKRAVVVGYLKLTSAIFYIFFSPNDSPSKTMKNKFTSSKKIF